jgi:B12-binding domain/radical SAM domain protein
LEVAKLVRKLHPDAKILMGGFSSTYYHRELIHYPQVDLVLRGDSTEVPVTELMQALEKGTPLEKVRNLTWKDDSGKVHFNELSYVPTDLDHLDVDYGWIVKSVIKHRDLEGFKPFKDWDRYPLTAVFTVRGCSVQCAVCGGSCSAMKGFLGRERPAYRSPEKVAGDIDNIQQYLKAPTFVVGDLRQNGKGYAERFFKEAKRLGIRNQLILETFSPANDEFFAMAQDSLESYSVEFSPDSHDERVRNALGRRFDTPSMERSVKSALDHGAERFDLFFMIGLPQQTKESALASAEYSRKMYEMVGNDERLFVFTSPLAPFLDPGSIIFENPSKYGYKTLARTLEEHRTRLLSPSWKYVLSYETEWMDRDQIADASYDAADILNNVRFECDQISKEELELRLVRSENARKMMVRIDGIVKMTNEKDRQDAFRSLKVETEELMESTICQKTDLEWASKGVVRSLPRAVLGLMKGKRRSK